jgi:hypothetical protein
MRAGTNTLTATPEPAAPAGAVLSLDDALRRLMQLMRAALEDAAAATVRGKSTRRAGPLLGVTEAMAAAQRGVVTMIPSIDRLAEDAMRAALTREQDAAWPAKGTSQRETRNLDNRRM